MDITQLFSSRIILANFFFVVLLTPYVGYAGPSGGALDVRQIPNTGGDTREEAIDTLDTVINTDRLTDDLQVKAYDLDPAQWEISQLALEDTVDQIVDYVNTGMDGNPAFVTNLDEYLLNKVDTEVSGFIQDLSSTLDSPFQADIQSALAEIHQQNMSGDLPGYQASSIADPEAFFSGDFTQGGWAGFYEAVNNPRQNTPIGARIQAIEEMRLVEERTRERERTQLNWGDGFRALEQCDGTGRNCQVTTPGQVIAGQLEGALNTPFNSLIAANALDMQVEPTFSLLASEALAGANGLLGLNFTAGELTSLLGNIFEDDSDTPTAPDNTIVVQNIDASISEEAAFSTTLTEYLSDNGDSITPEREAEILTAITESLSNQVQLNDLRIAAEEAESGGQTQTLQGVQNDYAAIRQDLNTSDDADDLIDQD